MNTAGWLPLHGDHGGISPSRTQGAWWVFEVSCSCSSADPLFLSWLLLLFLETRSANSQSYTAIIERSWLDLAGKRAGFLPAAPISAHVAGRSCSSSKLEMPCVVLSSTLSLLSLPPQSHNGLVCWFPGQGSAHCDFATTALGDNI